MRVHYIRLGKSDFVSTSNNSWISPVIDLYQNDSYFNYSTVKSNYGLEFNNSVWIGLSRLDTPRTWGELGSFTWHDLIGRLWRQEGGDTDSGVIVDGRFVDTSAEIDIISYDIEGTTVPVSMDVYNCDDLTKQFPVEWTLDPDLTPADEIDLLEAERYAKFVCNFTQDPGDDTVIYIRVEIGAPVITVKFHSTDNILDKFPQWMALHETDTVNAATPQSSVTTTVGGSFVNALAGQYLDDIYQQLVYTDLQHYVSSVDLNQKAWVYKVSNVPDFVYSVIGDDHQVGIAVDQRELYESLDDEDVFFWDENTKTIYCSRLYDSLQINGTIYSQAPHQIWNWIDELGLSVDLVRLRLEDNDSYRHRIIDVYQNRPGVGIEEFKNALRRELNLWKYETPSATPSSDYHGATPTILEISDIEKDPKYMDLDKIPTDALTKLIDDLSKNYPTTWGRFRWDKAIWDIGGTDGAGYKSLANRYDATSLSENDIQAGIGDGNDLFVYRPDVVTGPHDFSTSLIVRGKNSTAETHYPPVQVGLNIYGRADRKFYSNPPQTVWLTLEVQVYTSGVPGATYVYSFPLTATSDVDVDTPTATISSYATRNIFTADSGIDPSITLSNKVTGTLLSGRLLAKDIYQIRMKNGKWNQTGQNYNTLTGTDIFIAWFSDDATDTLTYNAGSPLLSGNAATPTTLPQAKVVMKSKVTSFVVSKWTSDKVARTITINGAFPNTSTLPYTLTMPVIAWDNHLEVTPNKEYVIELTTGSDIASPVFGGTVITDTPYFISFALINVNGSNAWTAGYQKVLPNTTTSVVFTTGMSGSYPIAGTSWSLFEKVQINAANGIVDENGPWHNATAPNPGNNNFILSNQLVGRNDFGIPFNDPTWVPTWIGVKVNGDDQVIAWLDTNVLTETNNSFGTITTRAKLRPTPAPQWNPQVNSGWFYENDDEYYFYASPSLEYVTMATPVLSRIARQGAPIIVKSVEATPKDFRQVAFLSHTTSSITTTTPKPFGVSSRFIAVGDSGSPHVIMYSDNNGVAWTGVANGLDGNTPPNGWTAWDIAYDGIGTLVAVGGNGHNSATPILNHITVNAIKSTDGGLTWTNLPLITGKANHVWGVGYSPGNGAWVFACEDYDNSTSQVYSSVDLVTFTPHTTRFDWTGFGSSIAAENVTCHDSTILVGGRARGLGNVNVLYTDYTIPGSPWNGYSSLSSVAAPSVPPSAAATVSKLTVSSGGHNILKVGYGQTTSPNVLPAPRHFAVSPDDNTIGFNQVWVQVALSHGSVTQVNVKPDIIFYDAAGNIISTTTTWDEPPTYPNGLVVDNSIGVVFNNWSQVFTLNGNVPVAPAGAAWVAFIITVEAVSGTFGVGDAIYFTDGTLSDEDRPVARTTDLVTWHYPSTASYEGQKIRYLNGHWFGSVDNGIDVSTDDGLTWTNILSSQLSGYSDGDIAYDGTVYIVAASRNSNPEGILLTSPDLITWTPQVIGGDPANTDIQCIVADENVIMYGGETYSGQTIATSSNHGVSSVMRDSDMNDAGLQQLIAIPYPTQDITYLVENTDLASPSSLSITNAELIYGNGATPMFLAYPDVYNVVVTDVTLSTPAIVSAQTSSTSNVILTTEPTDETHQYMVQYTLNNSFYAENDYEIPATPDQHTKLVFDRSTAELGVSNYAVTYESSVFNPATPVDLPLSPLFTTMDEGFVFISHDDYTLEQVTINISPSKLIADGHDYLIVTIHSLDINGNPKPNQAFQLSTTFGVFDKTSIVSDRDGFAVATLTAGPNPATPIFHGTIIVSGGVSASIDFDIDIINTRPYQLLAVVNTDQIPANGSSSNIVYGRVEDANTYAGKSNAVVRWRKARTIYELFGSTPVSAGQVVADGSGSFTVGPFNSATPTPGYWFVSLSSSGASPSGAYSEAGDVVFWYEYPDSTYGVNRMTGLPQAPIQMATPVSAAKPYSKQNMFPVNYDESVPFASATPVVIDWIPPPWYPMNLYQQYQLGLLGSTPNTIDPTYLPRIHPSFGEL